MNFKLELRGSKTIKAIYIRIYKSRFDISAPTNFSISESDWDSEKQLTKNDPDLNVKLTELLAFAMKRFNKDVGSGIIIDKLWLKSAVSEFCNRPKSEVSLRNHNWTIYLSDFSDYWLAEKSLKWKIAGEPMSEKSKLNYSSAAGFLKLFESDSKILLSACDGEFIQDFADYLSGMEYAKSSIRKTVERIRFFLSRAIEENLNVNKGFNRKIYVKDTEQVDDLYLNEEQINHIFNFDFSDDYDLDNARDNLIISCWTGQRISDFMHNLDVSNISDGMIRIKTQKTGAYVIIPVHPQVKSILSKRFGQLPKKTSDKEYNVLIKQVAKECGFTKVVFGKLFDKKTMRKKTGNFEQWRLISSHVGRRSAATNLKGKVSDEVIRSCLGWSSKALQDHYTKTTKIEYANELKKLYERI